MEALLDLAPRETGYEVPDIDLDIEFQETVIVHGFEACQNTVSCYTSAECKATSTYSAC